MEPFTYYIKKILLKLWVLPVFALWCIPAFSQETNTKNSQTNTEDAQQQKIETLKMAYLTNQLNLSPKEAQKFWPVYNKYEQELQQINEKERVNRQARNNLKNPTDQQIEQSLDKDFQLRQQALQLREKYRKQFRNAIPPRKVAKLYQSERDFNMKLIQELQRRQNTDNKSNNMLPQRQAKERNIQERPMRQGQRTRIQMQPHDRPIRIHRGRGR